jgi:hypothetical protein
MRAIAVPPIPRESTLPTMDQRLVRIKRLVAAGHFDFTLKADLECAADGLAREDVIESI